MSLGVKLRTAGVQSPSLSPGPDLKQEIPETPQIKEESEEQSVKQEEEQLPVPVPDYITVCVKSDEDVSEDEGAERMKERLEIHTRVHTGERAHSHSVSQTFTQKSDLQPCMRTLQWRSGAVWRPGRPIAPAPLTGNAEVGHLLLLQIQTEHQVGTRGGTEGHTEHSTDGKAPFPNDEDQSAAKKKKKKHQCSVCPKRFATRQGLQDHIRVHTGERPYSCSICEKRFARHGYLYRHMVTHTGEEGRHPCSFCGKKFHSKGDLCKHIRTHTGERLYSCSVCEKRFTQRSNLQRHMVTHTDAEGSTRALFVKGNFTINMNYKSTLDFTQERDRTAVQSVIKHLPGIVASKDTW
uniref:C2H2-type domain-containing protein n=1 Tax=Neogobius melanostomus TaxID=47308 RepID=A0A8C6TWU9_9GOBI